MEKDVSILTKVLLKMSDAARNSMPNGDAGDFLTDLQNVLAKDKDGLPGEFSGEMC